MKKYRILTYGCQMNKADSQRIAASLEKKGYKLAPSIEGADLLVVNMCSVRQTAVDRIYGLVPKFKRLKTKNYQLKTVLTGCILKKDRKKLAENFDSIASNKQYHGLVCGTNLIPISYGCGNSCAYCVVPFVKGPLVCRDPKEIIKEVKNAVKNNFEEIWLLGQNVNDYKYNKITFPKLLEIVAKIPGNFSIRFMSPNPKDFSDELIEIMAKYENVAKYLNLPVQSGDNKILRTMEREYTVEDYKKLVKKIRQKIPQINLTTDVIVGFPGETEKQFQNTVKLFKQIKFNMAYINKYSPRPGTTASKLKDNVPLKEKQRRWHILNKIAN